MAEQAIFVDFEEPAYFLGDIDGQQGWEVAQGNAEVVSEWAYGGSRSLKLFAGAPFSQAKLSLQARGPLSPVMFIDFHTRPVASVPVEQGEMLDVDGARIGFFRNPESKERAEFWVYDAQAAENSGEWVRTGWSVAIDPATGLPDKWVRLTLREDFARQVWDLSVEGELVAANLGFVERSVSKAESYIIMGDVQEAVYLDSLLVADWNPLGNDTDRDGLTDEKEIALGLNKFVDDRDDVTGPNGQSALALALSAKGSAEAIRLVTDLPRAPAISLLSGYVSSPVSVSLEAASGHAIFFTLDGSDPARAGAAARRYEGPLTIEETTVLRAVSRDEEGRVSLPVTRTWIFAEAVLRQDRPAGWPDSFWDQAKYTPEVREFRVPYRLELLPRNGGASVNGEEALRSLTSGPVVSLVVSPEDLVGFKTGIYAHSSYAGRNSTVPAAVSWWRSGGPATEESRAMVAISGESSRFHDVTLKHGFRVRLDQISSAFGSLLGGHGGPSRHFLLRSPTHDSWAQAGTGEWLRKEAKYVTDAWANQWMASQGYPSVRRQFTHLFLNGLYWGVYEVVEQPPPASERDALLSAEAGKIEVQAIYGSSDAWRQWIELLRTQVAEARARIASAQVWESLLSRCDTTNLIDYILLNLWLGNHDWPRRNFLIRDDGQRFRFQSWDAEFGLHFMGNLDQDHFPKLAEVVDGPAEAFWGLCHYSVFRDAVGERLKQLVAESGPLSVPEVARSYEALGEVFRPLAAAEAARWGVFYDSDHGTPSDWEREVVAVSQIIAPIRSRELPVQWARIDADFLRREIVWDTAAEARRLGENGPTLTPIGVIPPRGAIDPSEEDRDGDGLPDHWEREHGFDFAEPGDAEGDRDGDGLNNLEEYLLGLNPERADEASRYRFKLGDLAQTSPLANGLPKDPTLRREALHRLRAEPSTPLSDPQPPTSLEPSPASGN